MTAASGIYLILNTKNGKLYLGQAQDLRRRWNEHTRKLRNNIHKNAHLQAAWNKYGATAFVFKVLEHCDIDRLNEREQHFLNIYIPKGNCYNIALDVLAPRRGIPHSIETRRKMSEATRRQIPPMRGRNHSEMTRRKMSEAAKKRQPVSDETRKKIGEANRQRLPVSDKTRIKLSELSKGENNPMFGKPSHNKGKLTSEETKQKISEAQKRRWALKRLED